jgi:hypothetical protein
MTVADVRRGRGKSELNHGLVAEEGTEMETPKFMEIEEGYARFRPEGSVSLHEAVEVEKGVERWGILSISRAMRV